MSDPSKTTYGDRSPHAPQELDVFAFRQFDANRRTWIIEYLNVSHSFLRRQVNSDSGSVNVSGRTVTVGSESPGVTLREHYHVADRDNFVYRLDVSNDGGKSWNKGQIEMTFRRSSFS